MCQIFNIDFALDTRVKAIYELVCTIFCNFFGKADLQVDFKKIDPYNVGICELFEVFPCFLSVELSLV